MKNENTSPGIIAAITGIMKAIPIVGKDQKNEQQGYNYRGIDTLQAVLNPQLVKFGVVILPRMVKLTREEFTTAKGSLMNRAIVDVEFDLLAEDGSSKTVCFPGEAMDSGDKSVNKAMTMAYRTMGYHTFCIPKWEFLDTENDPDSEKVKKPVAKAAGKVRNAEPARGEQTAHEPLPPKVVIKKTVDPDVPAVAPSEFEKLLDEPMPYKAAVKIVVPFGKHKDTKVGALTLAQINAFMELMLRQRSEGALPDSRIAFYRACASVLEQNS